ncbi:hypothetical protein JTE90_020717 [Oedothorax gibbosus]|uniref:Uncharacterized protein n=1 Tax=Oedothorax gibbosus TaxID=931172 RepID=A0AAV6V5W8_9ARAC|nr:hypothetical protein JTE90_020717 [Oedothorax gibbosus]
MSMVTAALSLFDKWLRGRHLCRKVEIKAWHLPDGTPVLKRCHTIGRCRKLLLPHSPRLPDIVEVRCHIEVHEQIQTQEFDDSSDYDSDNSYPDDYNVDESSNHLVDDATVTLPVQLSTDYRFSRRSGHHVEVHFDFTEKQDSDCLKVGLFDIFKLYLREKMHICKSATRVVHSEL